MIRPWTRRELTYAAWSVVVLVLGVGLLGVLKLGAPQLGVLGLSVGPVALLGAWWGRRGRPAWQSFLAALLSSAVAFGGVLAACLEGVYLIGVLDPGGSPNGWGAVAGLQPHLADPNLARLLWPSVLQAGLALAFAEALLRLPAAGFRLRWALSTLAGGASFALAFDLVLDWAVYSELNPMVWETPLRARLVLVAGWIWTSLLIAIPVVGCLALAWVLTRARFGPEETDLVSGEPVSPSRRWRRASLPSEAQTELPSGASELMRPRSWTRHELARALASGLLVAGVSSLWVQPRLAVSIGALVGAVALLGSWQPAGRLSRLAEFGAVFSTSLVALILIVALDCHEVYLSVLGADGRELALTAAWAHCRALPSGDPRWVLGVCLAAGLALGEGALRVPAGELSYRPHLLAGPGLLSVIAALLAFGLGTYGQQYVWPVRVGLFAGLALLATLLSVVCGWVGLLVFALGAEFSENLLGPASVEAEPDTHHEREPESGAEP